MAVDSCCIILTVKMRFLVMYTINFGGAIFLIVTPELLVCPFASLFLEGADVGRCFPLTVLRR